MYVDVHTHLTHEKFAADRDQTIARAVDRGLAAIVVNGLEPQSNREILAMSKVHQVIKPALGIYPVDAVCNLLPHDFTLKVNKFDVDLEIEFIREQAKSGQLCAIGECGLDGYWPDPSTFPRQEEVFRALLEIATDYDLPVIIHTRKLEVRSAEILKEMNVKKVNFHCFGGKVKLAERWSRDEGWWFSIPANARVNQAFTKMLQTLPEDKILTETDAPYLAPTRGERNEPANVIGTIDFLAELRGWSVDQARSRVFENYKNLFGPKWC